MPDLLPTVGHPGGLRFLRTVIEGLTGERLDDPMAFPSAVAGELDGIVELGGDASKQWMRRGAPVFAGQASDRARQRVGGDDTQKDQPGTQATGKLGGDFARPRAVRRAIGRCNYGFEHGSLLIFVSDLRRFLQPYRPVT